MQIGSARTLNHVELVYRPGERELAKQVFELLGCNPVDRGGTWFTAFVDTGATDWCNNVCYASEVTPEQWAFEQTLADSPERTAHLERLRNEPQRSFHFGIRLPDEPTLTSTCAAIDTAGSNGGHLDGRIRVAGVFHPGEPGAVADSMIQAFVWTNVIASGLLTLGQHIELQHQL
jgi:hypothetical protein